MSEADKKNKIDQIGSPGNGVIGSGHTDAHKDLVGPATGPHQDAEEPEGHEGPIAVSRRRHGPQDFLVDGAVVKVFHDSS